jgi:hypothetical protein
MEQEIWQSVLSLFHPIILVARHQANLTDKEWAVSNRDTSALLVIGN